MNAGVVPPIGGHLGAHARPGTKVVECAASIQIVTPHVAQPMVQSQPAYGLRHDRPRNIGYTTRHATRGQAIPAPHGQETTQDRPARTNLRRLLPPQITQYSVTDRTPANTSCVDDVGHGVVNKGCVTQRSDDPRPGSVAALRRYRATVKGTVRRTTAKRSTPAHGRHES